MTENLRSVSIAEMIVSNKPSDVLVAYGLGSCVAVCLYDPIAQVGGMLHALLPTTSKANNSNGNPTKFVDQGVPILLQSIEKLGARHNRLSIQLCGGAQLISAPGFNDSLKIGHRNVLAAEAALQAIGLRIGSQSTGGNSGRTVKLYVSDGRVTVKTLGEGEKILT